MSLCVEADCGFCCDGTLYNEAPLQQAEFLPLQNLLDFPPTVDAATAADDMVFTQPCRQFVQGSCACYEARPAVCKSYRCKLLEDFTQGRVSLTQASKLIGTVKVLRKRLRPHLEKFTDNNSTVAFAVMTPAVIARMEGKSQEQQQVLAKEWLLDFALLRVLLGKNFEPRMTEFTWKAALSMQAAQTTASRPEPEF